MRSFKLFCSAIILSSAVFAQNNEPEALPEIPTLSIDAQKQKNPETPPANLPNAEAQNTLTPQSALLDSTQNTPASQMPTQNTEESNKPFLSENQEDNNSTKRSRDPFTPIITPKESGQITNAPQLDLFTKTELILPSTARKIKKIILEYQNLNGSITSLEQNLEGDIDWHFPLILSQEVQPKAPNVLDKQNFVLGNLFDFEISRQKIQLKAPLRLLRDFTLASPTRLILDFKVPNKTPLQEIFDTQIPTIPKVSLSTHLDFYRITFTLDGQYKYTLVQKTTGNYEIELH
ncbi:AMIN domain-containing protein [Helicobacter sp.]|uniref:AMIN domain-containing protein n=1 Tax=Helicobacter sp. TaxID=218 RepID=UPI0025BEF7D5|nr:AMIN domain-containing protein [Helicobacter sp.]